MEWWLGARKPFWYGLLGAAVFTFVILPGFFDLAELWGWIRYGT